MSSSKSPGRTSISLILAQLGNAVLVGDLGRAQRDQEGPRTLRARSRAKVISLLT